MYTAVVQVENEVRVFRAHSLGAVKNRALGELSLMVGFTVRTIEHLRDLEEDVTMDPEVQVDFFIGDTDELAKVNV